MHIGPTIKGGWLREVVEKVNDLGANLIAVTGDLVDGSVEGLGVDVAPLGTLTAPDGVYFVTGNHEYYSGADAWCAEIARIGLTVLNNAHRVVTRGAATMIVAGVTDYRAGRSNPAHATNPDAAIEGAPAADFKLLLAHQPRSIYGASRLGFESADLGTHPRGTVLSVEPPGRSRAAGDGGAAPLGAHLDLREPRHRLLGAAESRRCPFGDHLAHAAPRVITGRR